ncbi:MAG: hypothetical protein ACRD21_19110 [Vicinamibacteria bacterium]
MSAKSRTKKKPAKSPRKRARDIARERLRKAIEAIQDSPDEQEKFSLFPEGTLAFKAFALSDSNFEIWDAEKAERDPRKLAAQLRLYADHLRPGRSPDDLLYELILKSGLPLTAELEKVDVAGAAAYSIEGDALLLCLEEPVTEEILDAMVAREPRRIVCLDRAFQVTTRSRRMRCSP